MDDYLEANRRLWDAWTPLNVVSEFYDVEGFKAGRVDRPSMLHELEAGLVGDVTGRSLLHLQCHFGMDTIRWARRGARATGIDFSSAAIEAARRLAAEMGVPGNLRRERRLRAPRPPRRPLRRGLHLAWGSLLAARPRSLGEGHRPLPRAGRRLLHRRGPSRRDDLR